MSEEPMQLIVAHPWYKRQIVLFIGGSIVIAIILVVISMALYASSGAAQLDLSRPGYTSVQSQLDQSDGSFESFPATGSVDKKVIDEFQKQYQKQIKPVNGTDAFNASALDPQSLGIDAPGADQ